MTYEQWRIGYQDSEQAARAAFSMAVAHSQARGDLALELHEKDLLMKEARATLQMADEPDLDTPDPDDLANLNAAISDALGTLDKAVLIGPNDNSPVTGDMKHDYARGKLAILLRDVGNFTADEFWREMSRLASGATGREHAEGLQVQLLRSREEVKYWEQTMLRLLGVDGIKDVEREITALQNRVSIVSRNTSRLLELATAQQAWIDAVPKDIELPTMPGFDRDWADEVFNDAKDVPMPLASHPDFAEHQQANANMIDQLRASNRQHQQQVNLLTAQLLGIREAHTDAYWSNDDRQAAMDEALSARPLFRVLDARDEMNFRTGYAYGVSFHGLKNPGLTLPEDHNIQAAWEETKRVRKAMENDL